MTFGNGPSTSGTLDLNGFSPTVSSLAVSSASGTAAASQTITNNNPSAGLNPSTLTYNGSASSFGGVIADGGTNRVALNVTGSSSVLTLSGTNTYSGTGGTATTISGGER